MYKRTNPDWSIGFGLTKPDNIETTDITEKEIIWLYVAKGYDEKAVKELLSANKTK